MYINNLIYTATWEQHVKASIHFRLLTLGRCWTNTRYIMNWLMAAKVVSTWAEFAIVVRQRMTKKPMMCAQFIHVWPLIKSIVVHKKAYRERIPDLLFGGSGACLRKMVKERKLHLQGYPINLNARSNKTTLPTDPGWNPKGEHWYTFDSAIPAKRPADEGSK